MNENEQQDQQGQQLDMGKYGYQGNEGQYGQGQYDSEGKPDLRGTQAQEIIPDQQEQQNVQTQIPGGMINDADKPAVQKTQEQASQQ